MKKLKFLFSQTTHTTNSRYLEVHRYFIEKWKIRHSYLKMVQKCFVEVVCQEVSYECWMQTG